MERVASPGAVLCVIESFEVVDEQSPALTGNSADMNDVLEGRGFTCSIVRADCLFDSAERAAEIVAATFGDIIAGRVREAAWTLVPRYGAVWSKRLVP
jgi:hypothetical protein